MTTPSICNICNDRGTVTVFDFDGSEVVPCPCQSVNDMRARLAQAFGTDQQRTEIVRRSRAVPMRSPR